jgi:hypothetical protein
MKTSIVIMAVTAIVVGSPVVADPVVAGPDMTLSEAAQAKFNRDTRPDDRHFTPDPGSSGIPAPLYSAAGFTPDEAQGATLTQVAAAKFDRDGNSQGGLLARGSETTVSRAFGQDRDYSQLAMAAGLTPEEAAGMSFQEIATAKLNAEH